MNGWKNVCEECRQVQLLKASSASIVDLGLSLSTHMIALKCLTLFQGTWSYSFFYEQCIHMIYGYTCRKSIHTYKNKIIRREEKKTVIAKAFPIFFIPSSFNGQLHWLLFFTIVNTAENMEVLINLYGKVWRSSST